jgi:hypothetical protein
MLRIFKDKDTVVVTKGAYEQFYKPLGYQPVIENVKVEVKEKTSTESKKVNNDNEKSGEEKTVSSKKIKSEEK